MLLPNGRIARRTRPKIMLVAGRKSNLEVLPTKEETLAALKIDPADRTKKDIDIIMTTISKWKDFQKFIKTDQERREVCRAIRYEKYDSRQMIVRQHDEPDGWYLVFSGRCSIYILTTTETSNKNVHPDTLSVLRQHFGLTSNFINVATKYPSEEFGSTALTNNDRRNATVVADEPTIVLRVDPVLYKDMAAFYAQKNMQKKGHLLSQIKQLSFLGQENDNIYLRLGENMSEIRIEAGTVIDNQSHFVPGFIVIESGSIAKQRIVDFSNFSDNMLDEKKSPVDSTGSPLRLSVPAGKYPIRIETLGSGTMIPDPSLLDFIQYPFTLAVLETVKGYELKISDLTSMLFSTQIEQIKENFKKEPTDQEIVRTYVAKQEEVRWNNYKKKCFKDARRTAKVEKAASLGEWSIRRATAPKSIKSHKPQSVIRKHSLQQLDLC